jgi:hypothetical protein
MALQGILTPEIDPAEEASRRKVANALLLQASQYKPAMSGLSVLAHALQGGLGGYELAQEHLEKEREAEAIRQAGPDVLGISRPSVAPTPTPGRVAGALVGPDEPPPIRSTEPGGMLGNGTRILGEEGTPNVRVATAFSDLGLPAAPTQPPPTAPVATAEAIGRPQPQMPQPQQPSPVPLGSRGQPTVPPEIAARALRLWNLPKGRGQQAARDLVAPYQKPEEIQTHVLPNGDILQSDRSGNTQIKPAPNPGSIEVGGRPLNIPAGANVREAQTEATKAAMQKQIGQPAATSTAQTAIYEIDKQLENIDRLAAHPGTPKMVGLGGTLMSKIPGSEAAGAAAIADQLRAKSAFNALAEMRKASPTGGALGAVSDREDRMLADSEAALSQSQNFDDYKRNLQVYRQRAEQAKANIARAYKMDYGVDLPSVEREKGSALPQSGGIKIDKNGNIIP